MDRRRFLLTALAGALAAPRVAEAQEREKVYRVGYLESGSRSRLRGLAAFGQGMRDLPHGYRIDWRR